MTARPMPLRRDHRYDLVAFDWDGTLMDSTATIASSIQRACADLGLPVPSDARASHVIGLGLTDALAYAAPDLPKAKLPQMVERYRHHYLSRDADLPLFPGVREIVVALKEAGYFVAVATGKSRVGLDRALDMSGLRPLFDATRCADECRSKPDPQMLWDLGDALGVRNERMLMIGDTTHDLQMAANAGAASLAVSYGAHDGIALEGHGALAIVATPALLGKWLAANL
ncbi:MAG: HAD-IA family hydrolase [Burkholderiaceae bacterium]